MKSTIKQALMRLYGFGMSRAVVQRVYDFLRLKSA